MVYLADRRVFETPENSTSCDWALPFIFNRAYKRERIPDHEKEGRLGEDGAYVRNSKNILRRLFHDRAISMPFLIFEKSFPNILFDFVSGILLVKFIVDPSRVGIEPKDIRLIPFDDIWMGRNQLLHQRCAGTSITKKDNRGLQFVWHLATFFVARAILCILSFSRIYNQFHRISDGGDLRICIWSIDDSEHN